MNFFRGKENLDKYYKDNELEGSAYGLNLEEAFLVGKKIFTAEKILKEYEES